MGTQRERALDSHSSREEKRRSVRRDANCPGAQVDRVRAWIRQASLAILSGHVYLAPLVTNEKAPRVLASIGERTCAEREISARVGRARRDVEKLDPVVDSAGKAEPCRVTAKATDVVQVVRHPLHGELN